MSQLHATAGGLVLGLSALFAIVALATGAMDRSPRWVDRLRLVIAGLAVFAAAIGVALALNGRAPSEGIHWLYGAILVALPVIAGSIDLGGSARLRSAAYAVAGVVMAIVAWRLASSG